MFSVELSDKTSRDTTFEINKFLCLIGVIETNVVLDDLPIDAFINFVRVGEIPEEAMFMFNLISF